MNLFIEIFGQDKNLTAAQMACRGIAVFFIALLLIRVSGRRSFGIRTPLDNIVLILLGATLSRAIVGASPFIAVVITCFAIVLLHRLLGYIISRNQKVAEMLEGNKILLFSKGQFINENVQRALLCKEDIMQGVRKSVLTDNMDKIERIYMERNGEISTIMKEKT
ncbi:MAG: hypothetical protein JWP44_343 [Mucilaginibacter sp.]|nr:hypothetical protein [Mucilaginibacter sp.]